VPENRSGLKLYGEEANIPAPLQSDADFVSLLLTLRGGVAGYGARNGLCHTATNGEISHFRTSGNLRLCRDSNTRVRQKHFEIGVCYRGAADTLI
jgi:hypothetical protein